MPTETHPEPFIDEPLSETHSAEILPEPEDSVDLLDLALILAARKWSIFLFSFVVAVITAIVVLVVPKTFTATATMMPPQKESSAADMLGQLGGLASLVGGGSGGAADMLGLKNPDDLYIGLLRSQTVADAIIHRYNLQHIYKTKLLSGTRAALKSHTKILAEKSSLISIAVQDHDPDRAAAVANAYIAQLHNLMSHLAVTDAAQRRLFFQQQVELEKNELAKAELALENTEQKTGIIEPQGQAGAVIATIMELQAQISARQVELGAVRTSATDQNSQVITLQSQIQGLRQQLADFEKGHPGSAAIAGNPLTPTSEVPKAGLEYIRRMRDVKYHETLFELMARQYEMARVDEAKQSQMIQVVDPALVPDRRSWPPRALLVLLAFFLAGILASFWAILQSYFRSKLRNPVVAGKTAKLRSLLKP